MRNSKKPVAVEGVPFIAAAAAVTAALVLVASLAGIAFLWAVAALSLLVTLFTTYFFRNPARTPQGGEECIVSPADGRVIYLGKAREEHLGEEMQKISIFMSVFNVHINRAPVTGKVTDTFYTTGKFLDVRDERATFENEQSGLVIETEGGKRLVVVQVAGLIARRIVCYPGKGDSFRRGQRYGLIRFGSRLDVYLPLDAEIRVSLGQVTRAGETILGCLQ